MPLTYEVTTDSYLFGNMGIQDVKQRSGGMLKKFRLDVSWSLPEWYEAKRLRFLAHDILIPHRVHRLFAHMHGMLTFLTWLLVCFVASSYSFFSVI